MTTLVLVHAFQKKSTQGIKTPKHEIDLVQDRIRNADLGRFTLDRLVTIINRLGSRIEVKVKVRSMQPIQSVVA